MIKAESPPPLFAYRDGWHWNKGWPMVKGKVLRDCGCVLVCCWFCLWVVIAYFKVQALKFVCGLAQAFDQCVRPA